MLRADSFEHILMQGKIEGRRRRGRQRMRWLDGITTQWIWVWVNSGSWWWRGRPGVLRFMGSQRVGHNWATELNWRQHKFILWSAGRNFEMGLQDCVPSEGLGENLLVVFSSFWRPPASLGLWPHHSDLCFHHHITLSDSDPTAYPCDYTGGLLLIQDNLSILRVLNLTSPKQSLCHSQVLEMRTWTSLWGGEGAIIQPTISSSHFLVA